MSGFTHDTAAFFGELAEHNTREWFTAHRDEYERHVREPLEDLLDEAQERYGPGRVMRPNRDVRFSKDKSPYKVNGAMTAGGVYVSVSASGVHVGGGLYEPSRDQLDRARDAIATQPRVARALRETLEELERRGLHVAGPALKTAPRGYPRDHPDVDLLRLRHYAAIAHLPIDAPPQDIHDAWRAVEPLLAWVRAHAG